MAQAAEHKNAGLLNAGLLNAGLLNAGLLNAGLLNAGLLNGGTEGGHTLGKMKTWQNQPIDNVHVERDYLVGYAYVYEAVKGGYGWTYRKIQKLEFENATMEATVSVPGEAAIVNTVTLKITDIQTTVSGGQTFYQHVVQWRDNADNSYTPLCGYENASTTTPTPATLLQGEWNYTEGTADGGAKISNDPNKVTIACAQAALAKCGADKAIRGPSTPTSTSYNGVPDNVWVHKGSFPVYPGTTVTVKTWGGYGDPDLFVKWNGQPSSASYTCKSTSSTTVESCTLAVPPTATTIHVSLYGYDTGAAYLEVSSTSVKRGIGYTQYRYDCVWSPFGLLCNNTEATRQHQACTRMVTADYCGDGRSFTVTGRPIDVFDYYDPIVNEPDTSVAAENMPFEAEWDADGANWIGTCRVEDLHLSEEDPFSCPSYGGVTHDVKTYEPVYNQYGQQVACKAPMLIEYDTPGLLYNKNNGTYYPRQARY